MHVPPSPRRRNETAPGRLGRQRARVSLGGECDIGIVGDGQPGVNRAREKMMSDEAKKWSWIVAKLQRALGLAPPSLEEADAEMAEAEEVPMSDKEISHFLTFPSGGSI